MFWRLRFCGVTGVPCSGLVERLTRMFGGVGVTFTVTGKKPFRGDVGKGFIVVCMTCSSIIAYYGTLSQVPYSISHCGIERRVIFQKKGGAERLRGLPPVFATAVNSRLGSLILFMYRQGLVKKI